MKYIILALATTFSLSFCPSARADDSPDASKKEIPEVLIAGDSWSQVPCFFGSVRAAFEYRGLDVNTSDCLFTSRVGARAENFKSKSAYPRMMNDLKTHKAVRAVYLSLGGNDIFSYWNKNMSPAAELALFNTIRGNIEEVVNDIHSVRPDVWVLVAGYDYGYIKDHDIIKNYQDIFVHMGSPTTVEVNNGFFRLHDVLAKINLEHTAFQHHFGLMHYYYGVPEAGIGPGKTMKPEDISPPSHPTQVGGVITARNNKIAMAHIFTFYYDAHHLRPRGFTRLFEHSIDAYIGPWLKASGVKASATPKAEPNDDYDEGVTDEQQRQVEKELQDHFLD